MRVLSFISKEAQVNFFSATYPPDVLNYIDGMLK